MKYAFDVSVISPCYNVAPYVEKCLHSLVTQSIWDQGRLQIILINDGSTDNTLALLKDICTKYPQIELINQENKGLGPARNIGFERAKGKYVMFVDSDDWVATHDAIEKLFLVGERTNEYIISGKAEVFFAENHSENYYYPNFKKSEVKVFLEKKYAIFVEMPMIMSKLYRSDFIRHHCISFENTWAEDQLFSWKALLAAQGMYSIPEIVYCYLQRSDSLSKNVGIDKIEQLLDIRERQFDLLRNSEYPIDESLIDYLNYSYLMEIIRYIAGYKSSIDLGVDQGDADIINDRVHNIIGRSLKFHNLKAIVNFHPVISTIQHQYQLYEQRER